MSDARTSRTARPLRSLQIAFLLVAGLLFSQAAAAPAQVGKLLPTDEGIKNPEFFAFRARLQAALARRDVAAVLAVVDPQIKNTFGADDGIEAFKRLWKVPGGESRLWEELGLVLALGGKFQGENSFVAPYIFSHWPEPFDAFQHVAVLGSDVRVRAEPSTSSPVLATLTFDIVKLSESGRGKLRPEQAREWTAIELRGGRTGYISSRFVRSHVAHRAFFTRKAGGWKLDFFVAGD